MITRFFPIRIPLLVHPLVFLLLTLTTSFGQVSEQEMGRQTAELIRKTQGFYENEQALNLVAEVGKELEKQLGLSSPLTYHLVDVADPNAFATAGGYVFVTRGLLALLNSRDELACIMAHELTHVTQHHVKKQMTASIIPLVLEIPGKLIGALTYKELGNIINLPIEIPSQMLLKSYSRKEETEADLMGVDLAAKAGYDPFALGVVLQRLDQYVEAITGEHSHKSLFMDHPLTADRVATLTQHLTTSDTQPRAQFAGTNLKELDGVIFGQNPQEGIIHQNKYIQLELGIFCQFAPGWAIQNSPVTITAASPDRKSSIIVSVDNHDGTPAEAAREELKKINPHYIQNIKDTTVNGLPGVWANIRHHRVKYADHLMEVLWLKVPESTTLLKIIGLTSYKKPDPQVAKSMLTFRQLAPSDFTEVTFSKLQLRPIEEVRLLDTYTQNKGVQLINGFKEIKEVPTGNFLKIIESYPLSGY
jgi:predicted Zn-dependent protease